jgi:hypothetical protein
VCVCVQAYVGDPGSFEVTTLFNTVTPL